MDGRTDGWMDGWIDTEIKYSYKLNVDLEKKHIEKRHTEIWARIYQASQSAILVLSAENS